MKRCAILGVLLLVMLTVSSVAAAGPRTATDTFYGNATTGVGQPLPVDINPADIIVRSDGAIGLGYIYKANGIAQGSLPGDFVYEEHGYLFFYNPADPTTFAGSTFVSGVFTVDSHQPGSSVSVADTNPAAYIHGINVLNAASIKGAAGNLGKVLAVNGQSLKGSDLVYGYFTFTNDHGTFTGYATPNFQKFMIKITFDR